MSPYGDWSLPLAPVSNLFLVDLTMGSSTGYRRDVERCVKNKRLSMIHMLVHILYLSPRFLCNGISAERVLALDKMSRCDLEVFFLFRVIIESRDFDC